DQYGFLWIGTQDGLNRYDGKSFLQYRNEKSNPNSLPANYLWTIYEDESGILWIGTFGGGLSRFDPLTEQFENYRVDPRNSASFPSDRIFSIVEYPSGTLWIGCNEGLIEFDKSSGESKLYMAQRTSEQALQDNFVGTVALLDGMLWLRTNDGLTRFDPETKTHESFTFTPFSGDIELGDVYQIQVIDENIYLTCDAGLVILDFQAQTDRLLLSSQDPFFEGDYSRFSQFLQTSDHQFAIGSSKGLILLNTIDGRITKFVHDASDPESLAHNNIISLAQTHDQVLWLGTRNGLDLLEDLQPDFTHIRYLEGPDGLSTKNVNSFMTEDDQFMWVGTTDGLNLYDQKNQTFQVFKAGEAEAPALQSNYVLCLYRQQNGTRWLGTRRDGLYRIDKTGDEFKIARIRPTNSEEIQSSIHAIVEDHQGILWLGTGGNGLWQYDPKQNTIKKYPYNPDGTGPAHTYVFAVLEDSKHNLWLGTATGGLNLFDRQTERFLYFRKNPELDRTLSQNLVLSLFEDRQHQLWITTNGGISRLRIPLQENLFQQLENDAPIFESFGMEDGLPNEVVYGMVESDHQQLWMTTNHGIAVFNPKLKAAVANYDRSHGLQNNEFNQNGFYRDQYGRFFFGGVNGFNIFHPDSIQGNPFPAKTIMTGFSLFNEPIRVGSTYEKAGFSLSKQIYAIDDLRLKWHHDVITINYAGISFQSPEKNHYQYRLLGFKETWVDAGNQTAVTYTNLDPGSYTFEVKAANNSGLWVEEPTRLNIRVGAPPWANWYAYLTYALLVVGLFYALLRYRTQQATQKIRQDQEIENVRAQEREAFRKRSARDFHDEAGNKITRIGLVTELLRTNLKDDPENGEYFDQIEENLQQLNTGMRDFIWALDPEQDNLFDTFQRFTDFAGPMCEYAGVQFIASPLSGDLKHQELNMAQRRHLLMILKEAL
ncbi:MAG: two-component regulator propeller domain-containing protein, partial [Bacteroidota bacterium]